MELKEKYYFIAKPLITCVVKYKGTIVATFDELKESVDYIVSQLLVDSELHIEDFTISFKQNYSNIKLTQKGLNKLQEFFEERENFEN